MAQDHVNRAPNETGTTSCRSVNRICMLDFFSSFFLSLSLSVSTVSLFPNYSLIFDT